MLEADFKGSTSILGLSNKYFNYLFQLVCFWVYMIKRPNDFNKDSSHAKQSKGGLA